MDKIFGNIHKELKPTKYAGKCSKCLCVKEDFEEPPKDHDIIICNYCYNQICKDKERDDKIERVIALLKEMKVLSD
jgi:hypothetical protein